MTKTMIGALALSVSLLPAAADLHAKEKIKPAPTAPGQAVAPAMQIQIDPATGQKIMPGDLEGEAAQVQIVPQGFQTLDSGNKPVPVQHENGAVSLYVGQGMQKYLVMTIDENGQKHVEHRSTEDLQSPVAGQGGDEQ